MYILNLHTGISCFYNRINISSAVKWLSMEKVREQGAPLTGNDKESGRNQRIHVIRI